MITVVAFDILVVGMFVPQIIFGTHFLTFRDCLLDCSCVAVGMCCLLDCSCVAVSMCCFLDCSCVVVSMCCFLDCSCVAVSMC